MSRGVRSQNFFEVEKRGIVVDDTHPRETVAKEIG